MLVIYGMEFLLRIGSCLWLCLWDLSGSFFADVFLQFPWFSDVINDVFVSHANRMAQKQGTSIYARVAMRKY